MSKTVVIPLPDDEVWEEFRHAHNLAELQDAQTGSSAVMTLPAGWFVVKKVRQRLNVSWPYYEVYTEDCEKVAVFQWVAASLGFIKFRSKE